MSDTTNTCLDCDGPLQDHGGARWCPRCRMWKIVLDGAQVSCEGEPPIDPTFMSRYIQH